MTIRAIAAESKVGVFELRIQDKQQTIDAQQETIKIITAQLEKQTANRSDAGQVFTIDQERVANCREQLARADAEIQRLRHPNIFTRIFNPDVVIAGVVGYGVGKYTGGSSSVQLQNPFSNLALTGTSSKGNFVMFQTSVENQVKAALKKNGAIR